MLAPSLLPKVTFDSHFIFSFNFVILLAAQEGSPGLPGVHRNIGQEWKAGFLLCFVAELSLWQGSSGVTSGRRHCQLVGMNYLYLARQGCQNLGQEWDIGR